MSACHSNGASAPVNEKVSDAESQPFEFQTWVSFPPEVMDLLLEEKINRTEFLLLGMVASLYSKEWRGCYANNVYLGEALGLHRFNVSKTISKLVEMRVLKIHKKQGKRVLRVSWHGTVTTKGGYSAGRYRGIAPSAIHKELLSEDKEGEAGTASPPPPNGTSSNGHTNGHHVNKARFTFPAPPHVNGKEKKPRKADPLALSEAKKLRGALRAAKMPVRDVSLETAAENMRLIRDEDGLDPGPVLDFYVTNCTREKLAELGLPEVESARQFRKHVGWIDGVRRRRVRDVCDPCRRLRPEEQL